MKISVAIKTKDRGEGKNCLGKTLQNLNRAGFWESAHLHSLEVVGSGQVSRHFLASELEPEIPASSWAGYHDAASLQQTAREAIRLAASKPVDWCLVLEDDIDVCDDFLGSVARWLEQHATPEIPMYVFGANYPQIEQAEARNETSWAYPVELFYGAQALAWRREDAQQLAEWLGPDPHYDGNRDRHHDLLLKRWAEERGCKHFLASVPSFVQHVGRGSTLGNPFFQFRSWKGPEWRYEGRKRRVLWVGDANVSTGFARCTHAVCDHLHAQGWEVDIIGINYDGDPHDYPYRIFPCKSAIDDCRDHFGADRLPVMLWRRQYDLVVLLTDPWCVPEYLAAIKRRLPEDYPVPPIVGWLAVDAKHMRGDVLNGLAHVVTFTQFGSDELTAGGYQDTPSIVPLGVDHDLFAPREKAECRLATCPREMPPDAFLVGVVCRNQYRKRLDLSIEYFAEWIDRYGIDDAYLYLYVADLGSSTFVDLPRLCNYYGIDKAGKQRGIINAPDMRFGYPEDWLSVMYSSLDVLLSTSQGEGWGLPVLEAMACGVPCIVPSWAALAEWADGASYQVECSATALTGPLDRPAYALGGIADKEVTIDALNRLYQTRTVEGGGGFTWPDLRRRGLARSQEYSWKRTAEEFAAVVEHVLAVADAKSEEREAVVA